MHKLLLFFFSLFIGFSSSGQTSLSGSLVDAKTHEPVRYATIYVDGTVKGTISDSTGFFILKNLPLPCEVVVSHINYQTITVKYTTDNPSDLSLKLELTPRQVDIQEIVIRDKNRRESNLAYFQKTFLGDNKWGDYAFIKNDSVLFFTSKTRNDLNRIYMLHPDYPDSFQARASAPLQIELPLLGYQLYVNLEYFTVNYLDTIDQYQTHCIGYTYFIPNKPDSRYKQKRIDDHRKKVYYNSRLHFFRSLNKDELKANGYLFAQKGEWDPYRHKYIYDEMPIDSFIVHRNGGTSIIGLKNKGFYIIYYRNFKGNPCDLNKRRSSREPIISSIYFSKDTCFVDKNGRVMDQSIIFGPAIGDKKLGTWLPDNYYPEENKKGLTISF